MRNLRAQMLKRWPVILSVLLLAAFALSGRLSNAVKQMTVWQMAVWQIMDSGTQAQRLKASAMIASPAPLGLTAAAEPQVQIGSGPAAPLPSGYIPPACYPYKHSDFLVDCWLLQHPNIANSIAWQFDAESAAKAWPQWDRKSKDDLRAAFANARDWFNSGMTSYHGKLVQDPPTNLTDAMMIAGQSAYVVYTKEDAWGIYLGHVGLDLAAEIYGVVPWSLRNYDARALGHLFNAWSAQTPDNFNNGNMFRHAKGEAADGYKHAGWNGGRGRREGRADGRALE